MTPYEVKTLGEVSKKSRVLAYVLDLESSTIWVSKSGHGKILREAGLEMFNCRGGWIYPVEGRSSGGSGMLGGVEDRDLLPVIDAIGRTLGVQLRLR